MDLGKSLRVENVVDTGVESDLVGGSDFHTTETVEASTEKTAASTEKTTVSV